MLYHFNENLINSKLLNVKKKKKKKTQIQKKKKKTSSYKEGDERGGGQDRGSKLKVHTIRYVIGQFSCSVMSNSL